MGFNILKINQKITFLSSHHDKKKTLREGNFLIKKLFKILKSWKLTNYICIREKHKKKLEQKNQKITK